MTLAQQIARKNVTKVQIIDNAFNRYSFRDKEGLPQWFLDDENQHAYRNQLLRVQ